MENLDDMGEDFSGQMTSLFHQWLTPLVDLTMSPSQRVYWPFLILSLAFAALYSLKTLKDLTFKELLHVTFSRRGLFHKSSLLDFKLLLFNSTLKVFFFPLFMLSLFTVTTSVLHWSHRLFPGFNPLQASPLTKSVCATLIAFLISDFLRFLFHFLMHEISFLRNIHRTHHTAQVLTPFTLFRVHPLESVIGSTRNILTQGLFVGIYIFLFGGKMNAWDILGVNAFGFLFNAFGANLRHMPIPLSFGIFEYLFISPRMHQVHHSTKGAHQNKNHGVALSIWDLLFGTFYRPTEEDLKEMRFGITSHNHPYFEREATTLGAALIQPLNISKLIQKIKGESHEKAITRPFRA